MKIIQRLLVVAILSTLFIGVIWLSPFSYLIKGVRLTYLMGEKSASYLDYKHFDTREILNDPAKIWTVQVDTKAADCKLSVPLTEMLKKTNSGSFLVYHNDVLVCEKYYDPIHANERTNSFSMAKTFTAIMVQQCIERGEIGGWDDPVRKYLPWVGERDGEGELVSNTHPQWDQNANALTLRHLITMTAGLDWDENYISPFGITARAYYGSDVEATMRTVAVVDKPGEAFEYQSAATQLLGLVMMQATGKHLSELASEYLWKPLGAEAPALWSLDKAQGRELNYCCFDARARDFGRMGLMVLHDGVAAGKNRLLDSGFLAAAQRPYRFPNYGHSFWLGEVNGVQFSYFQGLKGQYICIVPSHNLVVVRTGNGVVKSTTGSRVFDCVKTYVAEAIKMVSAK